MSKAKGSVITGKPVTVRIASPAGAVRIETFIPWTLVKRKVRREIVTPIDAPAAFKEDVWQAKSRQEQHSPLLRSLGLAHYWQQLLDDGTFRSITEIAAAEGMDVGRVSRILRLAQLSPAIASATLTGTSQIMTFGTALRKAITCDWSLQHPATLVQSR